MERVNKILEDEKYQEHLSKIAACETNRKFCRHTINHFLDVCRIAWIKNLENQLGIEKEIIYAAGLLHDIGRWVEYETGEDHATVSAKLCVEILIHCEFRNTEIELIQIAIQEHRIKVHANDLSAILYKADKLSRNCISCEAIQDCKKFQNGEKYFLEV